MGGALTAFVGAARSAAAGLADPYFNYTTLLLPGTGTNGATNSAFLDSSSNPLTITRNGNTTQGAFSPFSQTGWSIYFNGSASQIFSLPPTNAMNFGTGDYTIEFWIYVFGTGNFCFIDNQGAGGNMQISRIDGLLYHGSQTNWSYAFPNNVWTHIAFARSGPNLRLFANGVLQQTQTNGSVIGSAINTNYIGIRSDGFYPLNGYASNLRVVKGQALYTGNFTPATSALTANTVGSTGAGAAQNITGTVSLLTCQSNRFVDNSTANSGTGFPITVNGTPSVQAFSPFAPTVAYSPALHGGSGYFDGTGDWLTIPSNAAINFSSASSFTFEAWIYPTAYAPGTQYIESRTIVSSTLASPAGWRVDIGTSILSFYTHGSGSAISTPVSLNAWTHFAVTHNGTTTKLYKNGKLAGSANTSWNASTSPFYIGALNSGLYIYPYLGYISSVRLINGTVGYDTEFTPPTAPHTAIANTSLLLNFTNAGIIDATAKNVLETWDGAQIRTTINNPFGAATGTMYFDGSGDYLTVPSNEGLAFGTGNFTFECWVYRIGSAASQCIYLVNANSGFIIYTVSNKVVVRSFGVADLITSTSNLEIAQWTHIAVARSGTALSLWLNGSTANGGTAVNSTNFPQGGVIIGTNETNSLPFYGYVSNLRVTKGVARTITTPTAPFPLL